jgi:hypothetical protein
VVDRALNFVANFEKDPAASPHLASVQDVPGDEGSKVRATWSRTPVDAATSPAQLCCYHIDRRPVSPSASPWLEVAVVPATASSTYEHLVSTPTDSVGADPALYRYRVVASAAGDTVEWISNEVEGYSVDNLAPPAPTSVSGSIASGFATLFWPAVTAPDLAHYRVYRGLEALPPLDDAHRIATTTSTGFSDSPGHFANYRVTTVDVHGNESQGCAFRPS